MKKLLSIIIAVLMLFCVFGEVAAETAALQRGHTAESSRAGMQDIAVSGNRVYSETAECLPEPEPNAPPVLAEDCPMPAPTESPRPAAHKRGEPIPNYILAASNGDMDALRGESVKSGSCGDNVSWFYDEDTHSMYITGSGPMYDYVYDHTNEVSNTPWEEYRESIESVYIGSGVTRIGNKAFAFCSDLTELEMTEGLETIGVGAFRGAYALSIDIPDSVSVIDDYAFYDVYIWDLHLGSGLTEIGGYAFFNGHGDIEELTIAGTSQLRTIGEYAFYGTYVESLTIEEGDSPLTIQRYAFCECSLLKSVVINRGRIDGLAFSYNIGLEEVYVGGEAELMPYAFCGSIDNRVHPFTLTIGNSLTRIPEHAFEECGITKLILGSGVTCIGEAAFKDCSYLEEVIGGDSVTTIEDYAFYDCYSHDMSFEWSSVREIGDYAFKNCLYETLELPAGLQTIGDHAFEECAIQILTLPDGLISIGDYAFAENEFSTAVIPASVIDIGDHAFYRYLDPETLLISATFLGDPPAVGYDVFNNEDGGFIVYYTYEHADAWAPNNEIEWEGYRIRCVDAFMLGMHTDAHKCYVGVYEIGTLKPVKNAAVKLTLPDNSTVTANTWNDGIAEFDVEAGSYSVHISKDNYLTSILQEVYLQKGGLAKLSLGKVGNSTGIESVFYCKRGAGSRGRDPYEERIDLLCNEVKLSQSSPVRFDIVVSSSLPQNKIKEYQLLQNGEIKARSTTGVFTLGASDLDDGAPVKVRIKKTDGYTKPMKIGLRIYKVPAFLENFDISPFETLALVIPDFVPIFSGHTVELDLGIVAAKYERTEDSIRVSFGTNNIFDMGDDEMWAKLKTATKNLNGNFISEFLESKTDQALSFNDFLDVGVSIFGYAEGSTNGDGLLEGGVSLSIRAGIKPEFPVMVCGVSCVLKFELEFKAELSGSVQFNIKTGELTFKNALEVELPRFRAGFGPGLVGKVFIGPYGECSLIARFQWDPIRYVQTRLEGEFGITGKLGVLEHDMVICHGSTVIAENYYKNGIGNVEETQRSAKDDASFTVAARDYLKQQSEWLGGTAKRDQQAARETVILQSGIFANAQPQMITAGGRTVMVWLADDGSRSTGNHSVLMFSVLNEDGTWTAPAPVWDDGTCDSAPKLATDGTDVYVVWEDANAEFDEELTIGEYCAALEISAAKFSDENGEYRFINQHRLTANAVMDGSPCIVFENGVPYAAWIRNDNSDWTGETGTNSIVYAPFGGNEIVLCTASAPIDALAAGELGGAATVCWSEDTDGSTETNTDLVLFICSLNGQPVQLTSNAVKDTQPQFVRVNGEGRLFFVSGTALMSYDGTDIRDEDAGINSLYCIAAGEDAAYLVHTVGSADGSQVFINRLDQQGEWGKPIALTDTEGYAEMPTAVATAEGGLVTAYVRTDVSLSDEGILTASDLYCTVMRPSCNITLNGITAGEEDGAPGEELPITLSVANNGELPIDSFTVTVSYEGAEDSVYQIDTALGSGETAEVYIQYLLPETVSTSDLRIILSIDGEDFDPADNTETVQVFFPDLSVKLHRMVSNDATVLIAAIANNGCIDTDVTVEIRRNGIGGELLQEIDIGTVGANALETLRLETDYIRDMIAGSDCLCFVARSSVNETAVGDNDCSINVYTDDTEEETAPVVLSVSYDEPALSGEDFEVTSELFCAAEIASVTIFYSINGGEEWTDEMTDYDGVYTAEITLPMDANTLSFRIIAENISGETCETDAFEVWCERESYTVTFIDWDEEIISEQTVYYGDAATAPEDPVREGYNFLGWDVDFSYVTEDLTVTALYEAALSVIMRGDVDCSGTVDAIDALLAMRYSMQLVQLSDQSLLNGDMNGDGTVNATDAVLIMRYLLSV
ncbi:MAG: leucine-rich repeat protein [Clostridia bacterium]|nr:leucine-rich repeat protein [Clostridia bacterium]